ncbi:MAG: hypothetical protein K0U34_01380 [Alphaproteobacteria bacterium]|nr:hypothetical protein [Alphaproteobacteria bacterium]
MRQVFFILILTILAALAAVSQSASAAQISATASAMNAHVSAAEAEGSRHVLKVRKWRRGRGWVPRRIRRHRARHRHRAWKRRDYYGTIISGIVLGTVIAAAAREANAPADDNVCWFWTNPNRTHGYWDYCD